MGLSVYSIQSVSVAYLHNILVHSVKELDYFPEYTLFEFTFEVISCFPFFDIFLVNIFLVLYIFCFMLYFCFNKENKVS